MQQIKLIDVQILIITVQQHGATNLAYTSSNNRGRDIRVQSKRVEYTRLFLVRTFNETQMDKLAYIMEAKCVNQTIWHKQIEQSDNGKLSIRTIIRILTLRPVDNFMTNKIPLFFHPVFMMQDPASFPFQ